jgi:hypothetical protein
MSTAQIFWSFLPQIIVQDSMIMQAAKRKFKASFEVGT